MFGKIIRYVVGNTFFPTYRFVVPPHRVGILEIEILKTNVLNRILYTDILNGMLIAHPLDEIVVAQILKTKVVRLILDNFQLHTIFGRGGRTGI